MKFQNLVQSHSEVFNAKERNRDKFLGKVNFCSKVKSWRDDWNFQIIKKLSYKMEGVIMNLF